MNKNEAEKIGEEKARQYNPEGLSPFPFKNITDDLDDLKILKSDALGNGISGAILYSTEAKSFIIMINSREAETRQNFTIAHEIGHYFLHNETIKKEVIVDGENTLDGNNILYRPAQYDRNILETEANNFAAALLMPANLVQNAWENLNDIEECAKIFHVSSVAMSIRLERLGLTQ